MKIVFCLFVSSKCIFRIPRNRKRCFYILREIICAVYAFNAIALATADLTSTVQNHIWLQYNFVFLWDDYQFHRKVLQGKEGFWRKGDGLRRFPQFQYWMFVLNKIKKFKKSNFELEGSFQASNDFFQFIYLPIFEWPLLWSVIMAIIWLSYQNSVYNFFQAKVCNSVFRDQISGLLLLEFTLFGWIWIVKKHLSLFAGR